MTVAQQLLQVERERLACLRALTPFYASGEARNAQAVALERQCDHLAVEASSLRARLTVFDIEQYYRLSHATA